MPIHAPDCEEKPKQYREEGICDHAHFTEMTGRDREYHSCQRTKGHAGKHTYLDRSTEEPLRWDCP